MSASIAYHGMFQKLVHNLEEITKNYRIVLDLVRKEKELLLQADIDGLVECNQSKEILVHKLKNLDTARERIARELAAHLGVDTQQPRLLEIASKLPMESGDRLRSIHATLDMIMRRLQELNKENEQYAQSALKTVGGALEELKSTLAGKKTYVKKGTLTQSPDQAGNLVSREA